MVSSIIPVPPFDLVIFGATGDLAHRKILPGLYRRMAVRQMPAGARVIGAARSKMTRAEFRESVRAALKEYVAPALLDMIGEFDTDRITQKNKKYEKHYKTLIEMPAVQTDEAITLYKFALKTLYEVLKQDFELINTIPLKRTSDFLASITQENEIEENAIANSSAQ